MKVTFFCYDIGGWQRPLPERPFDHALGGRETSQIRVAQELAKLGWDVDFAMPHARMDEGPVTADGLRWLDPREFLRTCGSTVDGILVSVESPSLFGKVTGSKASFIQAQCAHCQPTDNVTKKSDELTTNYLLLSHFQRWSLINRTPAISSDKCVKIGNGVDLARFDQIDVEKVPGRFVYSSSPDRGLHHLLRIWPHLHERYPHISLRVFYDLEGIQVHRWQHELRSEWLRTIDQGRNLPGVTYVGPIDQTSLASEIKQAELYCYPADPLWECETWCITALECLAARTPLLMSPIDALEEIYGGYSHFAPMPMKDEQWLGALAFLLDNPLERTKFVKVGRRFAETQTWKAVAQRWKDFILRRIELEDGDLDGILELISATEDRRSIARMASI